MDMENRIKLVIDTHTHTISSGHAYSTVQEMATVASEKNLEMFTITDHGPAMKGAPTLYYFEDIMEIPYKINGVRVVKGVEANIIDYSGKVDLPNEYLARLEFVLASFHDTCITPSTLDEHTNAVINVIKNPYIDAIAHPGNPQFQVDLDMVVKAAKEYGKLIEINNHSFSVRAGSENNCRNFALKCKEYGVCVVCGSDAHVSFKVGNFDNVYKLFEAVKMPEEIVLNTSVNKFDTFLKMRKKRLV